MAGAGEAEERIAGADLSGAGAGWGARLHAWKGNGERIQLGPASTETVRALCTGTRWPSLLDLPLPTFLRAHVVDGASQRGPGKLFGSFLYPSCASQCAGIAAKASSLVPPERGARMWLRPRAMGGGSSPHLVLSLTANPTVDSHGASRPGSLCPGGDKGSTGRVLAIEPSPAVSRQLGPRVGKWHKLSQGHCCPCKCSRLCPRMADFFFFFFACGVLFLAGKKKKAPTTSP